MWLHWNWLNFFLTYIIPRYIYFELTWIIHQIGEILGQVGSGFEIANNTRFFILERWNRTPCNFIVAIIALSLIILCLFFLQGWKRESNADKNMHGAPFHLLERKRIDFQREGITNLRIYQYWIFHYTMKHP